MEHRPKRLLDRVRDAIRLKHYSIRTEESYVAWIKRYILFHHKRHPNEMASAEIEAFLTHLAVDQKAASTQNQALSALLFLYRGVLNMPLDLPIDAMRAKKPKRLPTVLTKEETLNVIERLSGTQRLMAKLLFGGGLRLMECRRLRVKDLDFAQRQIIVRDWQRHGGSGHHAARKPDQPSPGTSLARQTITCARCRSKGRPGLFTVCAGTQVSACRPALDLAIRLSIRPSVERSTDGDHPPPSRECEWFAEGCEPSRATISGRCKNCWATKM
jgi:hypothetical protein